MNDAKHTKGPWHFAYDGPSLPIVCTENEIIALVRTGRTNENTEIEANARLIAAAPDLLEACKAAWAELDNRYDVDVPEPGHSKECPFNGAGELMRRLQAAIRKAEGK